MQSLCVVKKYMYLIYCVLYIEIMNWYKNSFEDQLQKEQFV